MKKIPTLFVRDPNNMSRVTDEVTPGCEWVLAGEGTATRKYDGTCCSVAEDLNFYRRRVVKPGKAAPAGFEPVDHDETTGKTVGWVPVGDGPEDRWHREAWAASPVESSNPGTYELIGPKVQGNPEATANHRLVRHGNHPLPLAPRDYDGLREYLLAFPGEGIVWHHPDGRMAKLKRRDFT